MLVRKTLTTLALTGLLGSATFAMTACERREGPAEEIGEAIDEARDNVADAIDPKGPVEKTGRKIDRALDND
jgi:hypothetical protein